MENVASELEQVGDAERARLRAWGGSGACDSLVGELN